MASIPFKLYYWPILTALWVIITFTTSYILAVNEDHVNPLFPYISDTGTVPPESCIFGQMLNIAAVLMFITMFIRYKIVNEMLNAQKHLIWNKISFGLGCFSCFGMSMVANFQEKNELGSHIVGASFAFLIGTVFCTIQSYLTYATRVGKLLVWIRIVTCFLMIPLYVSTIIATVISFKQFNASEPLKWSSDDEGFDLHLVATFSEWTIMLVIVLNVFSYFVEFKKYEMKKIVFYEKLYLPSVD